MLPSERNERWVQRIGFLILAVMVIYIIVWILRFIGGIWHKGLEERNIPTEEGARPALVEIAYGFSCIRDDGLMQENPSQDGVDACMGESRESWRITMIRETP